MPSPSTSRRTSAARGPRLATLTVVLVVLALAVGVAVSVQQERDEAPAALEVDNDPTLPNPMGGPAVAAPGVANGAGSLDGLRVEGTEVAMGAVPLGVTVVPGWDVHNDGDRAVTFTVASPQVVEGCCPGPVYVDGTMVEAGEPVTVDPDQAVRVEFPLQMHPGMDGPHHLRLPLTVDGDELLLHVTGDFRADAAGV